MEAPLVTIVTPSFNQGRFIRATVESVLAQQYPALEYIIIDGGSTDETAAVIRDYASRLRASRLRFVSEPDRGQSEAINKGFRLARGDILAWLNSDDILLGGAVKTAVDALAASPQAGAVHGEGYRMDEHGRWLGRFPFTEPFNLWKLVYLADYILQQTLYLRRTALERAGYLDESLHYTMDWDLLIRIGKQYPIRYVPAYLGAIREHARAKSFRGGWRRLCEIGRLLRKHTGRRLPPGLLLYALETYGRSFPLNILAGRWAERLRREAQGLYRDGWAAPRLRYMAPPGNGPVVIEGFVPDSPALNPQRLEVRCNGTPAASRQTGAGPFRIRIEEEALAELEIRASRWFRPELSEPGSGRRLAWVVKRIGRPDDDLVVSQNKS